MAKRLLLIMLFPALLLGKPFSNQTDACGGFFCTTFPINQVSEQILFVKGEGTVTTHVQIQYSGTAEDFAWVLPVPAIPELGVSHNAVFQQLSSFTQPSFFLDWKEDETCFFFPRFLAGEETLDAASGQPGSEVEVISQGQIGPYNTAVITASDPNAISEWLNTNGYRLDNLGSDLLKPYVDSGFYFLALRLAPDRDLGDLQPIALTYEAEQPGIPIRLTAVATQPDMGILVWVLGNQPAIPENYLHVEINEARIDWLNGGRNYNQVVAEAADEAGGRAFATDYAGTSSILKDRIFESERYNVDALRLIDNPSEFIAFMLITGFPRDSQSQSLIRRHIPMPPAVLTEGVLEVWFRGDEEAYQRAVDDGTLQDIADRSFYNNMEAYAKYTMDLNFDPNAFADELESVVVKPLRETQTLFDSNPFLTRLYTTMSADEMTEDPMFSFNTDLPEVSNTRRAQARCECPDGPDTAPENKLVVITLSDGREIRVKPDFNPGPFPFPLPGPVPTPFPAPILLDVEEQPLAASSIERLFSTGQPESIRGVTRPTPDFNSDGSVDFSDFLLFAEAFKSGALRYDLSANGKVNFEDFLIFLRTFIASAG